MNNPSSSLKRVSGPGVLDHDVVIVGWPCAPTTVPGGGAATTQHSSVPPLPGVDNSASSLSRYAVPSGAVPIATFSAAAVGTTGLGADDGDTRV